MPKGLPEIIEEALEEMERDFEEISSWDFEAGCIAPLVYVEETESEVVITADLPCVKKEDIKISAGERSVEIEAKAMEPFRFERWGFVQKKVEFSYFKKTVALRSKVDPNKAKASFRKGVLKITLPKAEERHEVKIL